MDIFVGGNSVELRRAQIWWMGLEMLWKMAFNEAVFGKGPTLEPPRDEELVTLLVRANALRFAGPTAYSPNLTQAPNNLSALTGLPHLTYLSFTDSSLSSLQEIKNLVNLRSLFAYNNQLTSLSGIEKMIHLEELYVQQNLISSLEPVRHLTNLRTLYVSNNRLTSLEGITIAHEDKMRNLYVIPNDEVRQREIIRVQNECGIICKKG